MKTSKRAWEVKHILVKISRLARYFRHTVSEEFGQPPFTRCAVDRRYLRIRAADYLESLNRHWI